MKNKKSQKSIFQQKTKFQKSRFQPKKKVVFRKNMKVLEFSTDHFSHNINFLVFGRKIKSHFISLDSVDIPEHVSDRFIGFDEEIFRDDISSTDIRREQN